MLVLAAALMVGRAVVVGAVREFGVLRHIGMTRRQVGAMLASEGLAVSGIGLVAGLGLGSAISLILIHVVNRQSFHWGMAVSVGRCARVRSAGGSTLTVACYRGPPSGSPRSCSSSSTNPPARVLLVALGLVLVLGAIEFLGQWPESRHGVTTPVMPRRGRSAVWPVGVVTVGRSVGATTALGLVALVGLRGSRQRQVGCRIRHDRQRRAESRARTDNAGSTGIAEAPDP
jgi:hypothetical protein